MRILISETPIFMNCRYGKCRRRSELRRHLIFIGLLEKESAFFGRQPELPEWVYNGLIIGVQGGNERSFSLLEKTICP